MLVDLHAYTERTGGKPLATLVADAIDRDIDAICIVDREASGEIAKTVVEGKFDIPVMVGVEIGTRSGDVLVFVPELDPLLTREEWRELTTLERPELSEVVAWARQNDGVALLAHPYDRNRRLAPRDRMFIATLVDGCQIGSNDAEPRSNRVALEAVGKSPLPSFGGSAQKNGTGDGSWLTLFADKVTSQTELIEAIRTGDFWAVQVDRTNASGRNSGGGGRKRDDRGGRRDGRRDGRRSGGGGGQRRRR